MSLSLAPGGSLVVSPGSRLTPDLRELVKGNKSVLVDWLQAANDLASSKLDANSRSVGWSRVDLPTAEKLVEPDPAVEPPEPPVDPNAWRELAAAYHCHHFNCSACIAAGRSAEYGLRCGAGAALWNAYQNT